jgi:hypothetical protein
LANALRAMRARRSRAFTRYDGNLGELTGLSKRMSRAFDGGVTSASAVERWSGCHFEYLLRNVVGVRRTDRPEERWRIGHDERGNLFHRILDRFYRALAKQGRLTGPIKFGPADHLAIEQIAADEIMVLETTGKTGHLLTWDAERESILADLHALLEWEQAWSIESGVVPALFEHCFGYDEAPAPDRPAGWPAATVTLEDGRRVTFLGQVDRVDFGRPTPSLVGHSSWITSRAPHAVSPTWAKTHCKAGATSSSRSTPARCEPRWWSRWGRSRPR